jgi:hypothetical protein
MPDASLLLLLTRMQAGPAHQLSEVQSQHPITNTR